MKEGATNLIKIVSIHPAGDAVLEPGFSDSTIGCWSAGTLIAGATVLTEPLADPAYFARAFIEAGALAWPNGLELSPAALHRELAESDKLSRMAA